MVFLGDALVHPQAAVFISIFRVPFFQKGLVAQVGVIGGQGQVGQTVEPLSVNLGIVRAQRLRPGRGQVLRHDVLDGIHFVGQVVEYVFGFQGAKIFKPLEEIRLVSAPHLIDLFGCQGGGELLIVGKTPTVPFGQQGINQLIHIAVGGTVIAQNLPVQIQKNLVEGVGGNLTDIPAEQIIFHDGKDPVHLLLSQLPGLVQAQHFHQEGAGDSDFQPVHSVHALV